MFVRFLMAVLCTGAKNTIKIKSFRETIIYQNKTEYIAYSYTAGKGWIYCDAKNADLC